jgi:hypothetical protein
MIVLALMASLPEVVCCCEVSWGHGGLLGSKALCRQPYAVATRCCCDSCGQGGQDSNCVDSGCDCKFSLVSPAPIAESRDVELDQPHLVDALLPPACVTAEARLASVDVEVDHTPPPLKSARRCAMLQTWRI